MRGRFLLWLLAAIIVHGGGSLWGAYVLQALWGWFIIPAFRAAALPFMGAVGIMLMFRLGYQVRLEVNTTESADAKTRIMNRFKADEELE